MMPAELAAQPLAEVDLVFADTETTGFSPRAGGELVELAGVRCRDGLVIDRFQQLIRPQRVIPDHVIRIHGITNAMVQNAPPVADVLAAFLRFSEGALWVFHNAPFDLAFLVAAARAAGQELPDTGVLDTLTMARRLYPGQRHALPLLAERFGVEQPHAHRALCDAETAMQLFHIFVRDAHGLLPPALGDVAAVAWHGRLRALAGGDGGQE